MGVCSRELLRNFMIHEQEFTYRIEEASIMVDVERPLRTILSRSDAPKGKIRLAILCSILNKIWDLAPPLLIGVAVDVVVQKEDSLLAQWGIIDPWNQLIVLAVATFVIWGLESLFEYFYAVLWRNLAQTVQHNLRITTFDHVQNQSMTWFDEHQKGDLLAIMNDDVNQLERFLDKGANRSVAGDNNCDCCWCRVLVSLMGNCTVCSTANSCYPLGFLPVSEETRGPISQCSRQLRDN